MKDLKSFGHNARAGSTPASTTCRSLMMAWEKMSKSRGNVVLPEEVVYGVCDLAIGFEFRNLRKSGLEFVDWTKIGIWQDKGNTGFFYTTTKFGREPVWLCEVNNSNPCVLLINGDEKVQHPDFEEVQYFAYIIKGEK